MAERICMALEAKDLNDTDRAILDYFADVERSTPTLYLRENDVDTSRQWASSRFVRLAEHGHLRELYETGVYELVSDPRENC